MSSKLSLTVGEQEKAVGTFSRTFLSLTMLVLSAAVLPLTLRTMLLLVKTLPALEMPLLVLSTEMGLSWRKREASDVADDMDEVEDDWTN